MATYIQGASVNESRTACSASRAAAKMGNRSHPAVHQLRLTHSTGRSEALHALAVCLTADRSQGTNGHNGCTKYGCMYMCSTDQAACIQDNTT